jgi:hypothetical protein
MSMYLLVSYDVTIYNNINQISAIFYSNNNQSLPSFMDYWYLIILISNLTSWQNLTFAIV